MVPAGPAKEERVGIGGGGLVRPLRLEGKFNENTGLHLTRYDFTHGQPTQWVKGVRVILKADPSAPSGYRVLTSFPQP
ncbi:RNase A-like domain-containing protein [Streptomyces sp. WG7]|uniref:RNase A-like domain-containing protein n=1 Tax=Streptomyces sp. WG7 TaxID=3417650 RepID=UPI003CF8EB15